MFSLNAVYRFPSTVASGVGVAFALLFHNPVSTGSNVDFLGCAVFRKTYVANHSILFLLEGNDDVQK